MLEHARNILVATKKLAEAADQYARRYRRMPAEWIPRWLLSILIRAAAADNKYSLDEERLVATLGGELGYVDVFDFADMQVLVTQVGDEDILKPLRTIRQVERLHGDLGITAALVRSAVILAKVVMVADYDVANDEIAWYTDFVTNACIELRLDPSEILQDVSAEKFPQRTPAGVWV
jgi:hypothetical protein